MIAIDGTIVSGAGVVYVDGQIAAGGGGEGGVPTFTTASRPNAAIFPPGTTGWNTQTSMPNFSAGLSGRWYDAAGNQV